MMDRPSENPSSPYRDKYIREIEGRDVFSDKYLKTEQAIKVIKRIIKFHRAGKGYEAAKYTLFLYECSHYEPFSSEGRNWEVWDCIWGAANEAFPESGSGIWYNGKGYKYLSEQKTLNLALEKLEALPTVRQARLSRTLKKASPNGGSKNISI